MWLMSRDPVVNFANMIFILLKTYLNESFPFQVAQHHNSAPSERRSSRSTPPATVRQDSKSSFMSVLTRSRTESSDDPQPPPPSSSTTIDADLNKSEADQPLDTFQSTEELQLSSTTLYCLVIHLKETYFYFRNKCYRGPWSKTWHLWRYYDREHV